MSNETEKQKKDTDLYRAVIKSQNNNHTDVCELIKLLVNDNIICKTLGKQIIWYVKTTNETYRQAQELEIRQLIFPKLIKVYHRTANYLLENIFDDEYELVKPHYMVLARKLLYVSSKLHQSGFKKSVMSELPYVLYNH